MDNPSADPSASAKPGTSQAPDAPIVKEESPKEESSKEESSKQGNLHNGLDLLRTSKALQK